ncbi:hypothetical protein [Actinomycetospora aeridis]|uniref:Integral membrane protein n=1 Tax=Actinomycetospora aeridis TaxID=3129231 RepID=A0ABU8NGU2_9PSEU
MRAEGARRAALRVAAVALLVDGLGFGVFVPVAIASIAQGRGVPLVLGFPTYGGGPFAGYGVPTTVPLLLAFGAVCLLQGVAAVLVWRRRPSGAVLTLVAVALGAVFWWGFALPFGPVLGVLAVVLVLVGWPALAQSER